MARRAPVAFAGAAALPARRPHPVSSVRRTVCASANPPSPIVLAPGQGAQTAGMGLAWADRSPVAASLLAEADSLLAGRFAAPLSSIMSAGGGTLNRTDVAQPALFVAGAMSLAGGLDAPPCATGGLSLGEYTALYAAGALSFADGVRLVAARGAAMQAAADASSGGMVALIGADAAVAREVADAARGGDVLVASNFNAPGQVVLSGSSEAVARAADAAKERGIRAAVLDVAGAFHSPLMQPAADRLAEELAKVDIMPMKCPVVSNVTGEAFVEGEVAARLAQGLVSEVRWEKCVRKLIGVAGEMQNETEFVELAPGRTLSGMMRKIDRKTKVRLLDAPAAVAAE